MTKDELVEMCKETSLSTVICYSGISLGAPWPRCEMGTSAIFDPGHTHRYKCINMLK
jgi:hypothetical protein